MKLIDLLVQELPKRGGWPEGVKRINQGHDGKLEDYRSCGDSYSLDREISLPLLSDDYRLESQFVAECSADFVTREQYDAALAVLQQPVWNGEGLPPVGCKFEYGSHRTTATCLGVGFNMVFACKGTTEEDDYEEFMISIFDSSFHKPRTEAERRREKAIDFIDGNICDMNRNLAGRIYDLIAAGEIPGVKLDV